MRYTLVELKRAILSISFLLSVITMAMVMVYCVNETIIKMLNNELAELRSNDYIHCYTYVYETIEETL